MKLNVEGHGDRKEKEKTEGRTPPIVILHGLFGSGQNWRSIAKGLLNENKLKDRQIFLPDLRNHGESPHSEAHSYPLMAEDIIAFIDTELGEAVDLIGHSMGGKIAIQVASMAPERVKSLIVVDIAPKQYPNNQHDEVFTAIKSVDLNLLKTRMDAIPELNKSLNDPALSQFLIKNLGRNKKGFYWQINHESLEKNYTEIAAAPLIKTKITTPTLFIRGDNSDYIDTEKDPELFSDYFENWELESIPNAGHWLHAEKPEETREIISRFLGKTYKLKYFVVNN